MSAKQYKAQQFIDAIEGSAGIVSTIAKRVGCDWHTARKYIDEYATIKQAYDDECERTLDAAESVILGDIVKEKDVQTAKWYLSMKGRSRGYAKTERTEVTGRDGGPIEFDLDEWKQQQQERLAQIEAMPETKTGDAITNA